MALSSFNSYRAEMLGLPLSSIWRGHGSAIFLEFGPLTPLQRINGSAGNLTGDFTIMMEWSWRIEDRSSILGGSWNEEAGWAAIFESLAGRTVEDLTIIGRLPELSLALSGDRHVVSFMTAEGQPSWTLFKRSETPMPYLSVADGALVSQW